MPKKPRQQLKVLSPRTQAAQSEFRNCDAPGGCPNIVSVVDRPKNFPGPIYCSLHSHLMEKT